MIRSKLNPFHAKSVKENMNIYLHFMSYLQNDMTQVGEIKLRVNLWNILCEKEWPKSWWINLICLCGMWIIPKWIVGWTTIRMLIFFALNSLIWIEEKPVVVWREMVYCKYLDYQWLVAKRSYPSLCMGQWSWGLTFLQVVYHLPPMHIPGNSSSFASETKR